MNNPLLFGLIIVIFSAVLPAQGSTHPLFVIERTQSSNKVYYEARTAKDGTLDRSAPVHPYWILWAKDSSGNTREELNFIEREKAYGVHAKRAVQDNSFQFVIAAVPSRTITVSLHNGKPIAVVTIDGNPSRLERVLIHNCATCLIPKVFYVELFGTDVRTGEKRCEKVFPSRKG